MSTLLTLVTVAALAQCEEARLFDGPPAESPNPWPVAIDIAGDGQSAVVGVSRSGAWAGSIQIFDRADVAWLEEVVLTAPDGETDDYLGRAVAISTDGRTILAGAPGDDDIGPSAGAAYVWSNAPGGDWVLEAKLLGPKSDEVSLGWIVALSGNGETAVVAAWDGSARVFRRQGDGTWHEDGPLPPVSFVHAISLSFDGNAALVGGSQEVFLLEREAGGTWKEQFLFKPPTDAGIHFGRAAWLSSDGLVAAIGAPRATLSNEMTGAVLIYERQEGDWMLQAVLGPQEFVSGDMPEFGVAVDGDADARTLVIGAPNDSLPFWRTGSVHVFRRQGDVWYSVARLTATDAEGREELGSTVACAADGSIAVGGTISSADSHKAYVFNLDAPDCNGNGRCDPTDLNSGLSPDVNGNGLPDECEQPAVHCAPRQLTLDRPANVDYFGRDVAIDGDLAIIGVPGRDTGAASTGAAVVLRHHPGGWVQEQDLIADDGTVAAQLGWAAAISGNVAVVGAPFSDDLNAPEGAAYVFRFDGAAWHQEQKLVASDAQPSARFGSSVAVEGDVIVVGAPYRAPGAAYVFRWNGAAWVQEQRLAALGAEGTDAFGASVTIDGSRIAVGAPDDDAAAVRSGSASVFVADGSAWSLRQVLFAADGDTDDSFGAAVALSGPVLAIGAPHDSDLGYRAGSAYVYRHSGRDWQLERKLAASDPHADALFGYRVAVARERMVVTAPEDIASGTDSGSADEFLHDGDGWRHVLKLVPPDGYPSDRFGFGAALSEMHLLIGSPGHGAVADNSGTVYAWDLAGGCSGDLNGDGFVEGADLALMLEAFGPCPGPPDFCPGDLDGDGSVSIRDLLELLANWS